VRHPTDPFRTVVFDCDSTLSAIEGVDELAGAHHAEVAALTDAAMRGEIRLEDVYGRRLALIQPTRAQVEALGTRYVDTLVPDARAVVAALRGAGVAVRVMSGGLLPAVLALGAALGLAADDVGAVAVTFDDEGRYLDYDAASPLARAGGKLALLAEWRRSLPGPVLLVGDGATDLEAAPAADLFVAFAGVVDRAAVTAHAPVVIRSNSLAPVYALALGATPPTAPDARALYDRGRALLGGAAAAPTTPHTTRT
jgi:phosphoserine phosphatase